MEHERGVDHRPAFRTRLEWPVDRFGSRVDGLPEDAPRTDGFRHGTRERGLDPQQEDPGDDRRSLQRPLQCFCGSTVPTRVSGFGSAKHLPDLPDPLLGEPHFGGQLAILLRPIHIGPLGPERSAVKLLA